MPDNPLEDRGRSLEEEHFRKKDRELIERMRQGAAIENARQEISRKTGLVDPEQLRELLALGFTPETVSLLPLVPVLQMAWAEGGITNQERELLVRLARSRGIEDGSPADRQLAIWMASRPDEAVFKGAGRLIRAMLDVESGKTDVLSAEDLVRHCEAIAAASGGVFGIGRVSSEERALLSAIAGDLKVRRA